MTLILKSDKVATRSIGNLNGLVGPGDYSLLMDFERGIYRLGVGAQREAKTLSEMVVCSRLSSAHYTDAAGVRRVVGNDTPRISWRHDLGRGGLLTETQRRNYLLNPGEPETQTVSGLGTGDYVLWMEGAGSAAVSGDISSPPAAATDGHPVLLTVVAPGTVTVTVTGSPTIFQLEKTEGGGGPSSYIETSVRQGDLIRLTPAALAQVNQSEGMMVVHAIHGSLINGTEAAGKSLLRFGRNSSANGTIQIITSAYAAGRGVVQGAISDESGGAQMLGSAGSAAATDPIIVVMAYKANNSAVQMKSVVGTDTTVALPAGRDLVEIGSTRWSPAAAWCGLITKIVLYPRRGAASEMSDIALQDF